MAVVAVKSAGITNRDAVPVVLNQGGLVNARVHRSAGMVAITSGDSANSTYTVCSIPSNAFVSALFVTAPDIGTTTAADIGLYDTTANGGAVVSGQLFKSGFVLNAGAVQRSDANGTSAANSEKRVWELLGLSSDPGKMYDIVLKLSGAADGSGNVFVECFYTQ
jgi:hypothetical protein